MIFENLAMGDLSLSVLFCESIVQAHYQLYLGLRSLFESMKDC